MVAPVCAACQVPFLGISVKKFVDTMVDRVHDVKADPITLRSDVAKRSESLLQGQARTLLHIEEALLVVGVLLIKTPFPVGTEWFDVCQSGWFARQLLHYFRDAAYASVRGLRMGWMCGRVACAGVWAPPPPLGCVGLGVGVGMGASAGLGLSNVPCGRVCVCL